jgi:hypothetical protein
MVLIRILKQTGGYQPGEEVDLPPEAFEGWTDAGIAELVRAEPETTEALPAPERAVTRRGRSR